MAQSALIGLTDFAGSWRIDRVIRDAALGQVGRLTGRATFEADAHGLIYEEAGDLRYGSGAPMRAQRRYLWRQEAPGRIAVFYEDGRAFHAFALGSSAEARHECPPDLYQVVYDFSRWPEWRAVWTVTGPRKDYVSETIFTR